MIKMTKFGSATNKQIAELESKYHLKLPEDYKRFLMETDGGRAVLAESNAIEIPDLGVSVHADIFFGCNINIKEVNLFFWMDRLQEDILEQVLLIGDSIEHGFFVINCGDEEPGVYYWDDTYALEGSNDAYNTFWIADTFTELLEKL